MGEGLRRQSHQDSQQNPKTVLFLDLVQDWWPRQKESEKSQYRYRSFGVCPRQRRLQ